MRQKVWFDYPVYDDEGNPIKDKYGKPKTELKQSKARVQFKSNIVKDAKGEERRTSVEIDLPVSFNPTVGASYEYTDINGNKVTGAIISKDEAINLAGTKVYYRTVYCDG
ncbi:hypothetical protein [Oceanobacillus sp. J11TS1]|uniref:hypothetical protein n=1 Tax=Oceanobacillus sp. J11TS1 TaxID=2807191 RepID=UPI001B023EBF|nr:hypothetical protein [Oceanobacillus sp. J11TS1]GIO25098.1 hypothetical protein J11TS1_36790 [Oceanobacillus sp. J11TS1]